MQQYFKHDVSCLLTGSWLDHILLLVCFCKLLYSVKVFPQSYQNILRVEGQPKKILVRYAKSSFLMKTKLPEKYICAIFSSWCFFYNIIYIFTFPIFFLFSRYIPALKYGTLESTVVNVQTISDSHSCITFPTSISVEYM